MKEPRVCVLLAAYNGETYIRQQIDSVLAQDYANVQIVLSDDCSTDATLEILELYKQSFPERVIHYKSGKRFGSAHKHFLHLLTEFHDAPYVMFCDQDDVWHQDKVRKTLEKMKDIEDNPKIPAMVHTDLRVVDQNLQEISSSFCEYSAIKGNRLLLNQLLVQNVVTGCTVMMNHALAELAATAIPEEGIVMHDWWIALLAAASGRTAFLDEALIDYRQHGSNTVGAKNVKSIPYLWARLASRKKMRDSLTVAAKQAELLLTCYQSWLGKDAIVLIEKFASISDKGTIARDIIFLKNKLLKDSFIRIIPQLLGL